MPTTKLGLRRPARNRREPGSTPRVIPTNVHGALDYAASGFNLLAPALLGVRDSSTASRALRFNGAAGAAYSLLTDYEFGLVRAIPMPAHLVLDAAKGALLASSPWIFGFAGRGARYWLPHVVMGAGDLLVAVTTKRG